MFPRLSLILPLLVSACAAPGPSVSAEAAAPVFGPVRPVDQAPDPVRPAYDGKAPVALGSLSIEGPVEPIAPGIWSSLDLRGVVAEVEHNAGALQRCYEKRLREVPGLQGTISIHAHITPQGEVDGQCITDDELNDPVMVKCVNELIARGRYPTGHAETVDVTFPFKFSPPTS